MKGRGIIRETGMVRLPPNHHMQARWLAGRLALPGANFNHIAICRCGFSALTARDGDINMRPMFGLFRKVFWLALFLLSTFAFTVLFEHGTSNFQENARVEFENVKKLVNTQITRPKDESDKIAH